MVRPIWGGIAVLVLGLLIATQSFAGPAAPGAIEGLGKAGGDHHSLAVFYEEQAQSYKTKAENWEFAADYYQKFPEELAGGKEAAAEHVSHCRLAAEESRKLEQQNRELAAKHRALMRKDLK